MFISARGWLQLDHKHRPEVDGVIAAARDELYSGGWSFPTKTFNWSLYVFYGGDIRESAISWLERQVAEIAALPPVDEDCDCPLGFFALTDERGRAWTWRVADGVVSESEDPSFSYLNPS